MRKWLMPQALLVMLMLVAAPCAALAHLLIVWVPDQVAVVQLSSDVTRTSARLEAERDQHQRFRDEIERMEQLRTERARQAEWLPQRQKDAVFDCLAEAFSDPRVSIEQLTLGEPDLYVGVSATALLACEQAQVVCQGDYEALTECLDRLFAAPLPLRVAQLAWRPAGEALSLDIRIQVPFTPDSDLRAVLARGAGLEVEEDDEE